MRAAWAAGFPPDAPELSRDAPEGRRRAALPALPGESEPDFLSISSLQPIAVVQYSVFSGRMPLLSVAGVAVRKNLRRSRVEDDTSEALNMSFSSRRRSRRSCISRSRRVLRSASASPASSILRAPGEIEFTSLDAAERAIPEWAESEGEGAPGELRRCSSATSTFPSLSAGKPTPLGDIVRFAIPCSIIRLKSQPGGPACRAGVARPERSGKNGLRVSSPAADCAAVRGRAKSGAISIRSPERSCAPWREARVEPASERARRA